METKVCTSCYWRLPIGAFNKSSRIGHVARCRSCYTVYYNQWKTKQHIKRHIVYLLPKLDYVGATASLNLRLRNHRSHGKDTTDYEILYQTDCYKEASSVEKQYHDYGYDGVGMMEYEEPVGYKYIELIPQIPNPTTGLYW